ncbi:MAG: hypothetical protein JXQ80_07595 [Bacteroidales bacterium]|nr:hypothetical protein [Bacteroidales bacterium]
MYTKNIFAKISALTLLAVVLCFFSSCKGGKQSPSQDELATDSIDKELLASDIREVIFPLPAPFELTQMLNEIGATYSPKILNSVNNVEKYVTEQSKALNLGIYGADLAYAATYEQQQDIQTYLNALKSLADQLGVTYDYSKLLTDEYKEKFQNKDTLTEIITNTVYDTYSFLDEKSNPDLAVNMVAGVWVELMYIATNISEASYNFTGLVDIISKQKTSYEKVMGLLASRNTNAEIKSLEAKLMALKPVYDKVEAGLSEADYNLILKTIQDVRNALI